MSKISKYLKIWFRLNKLSLMITLEYRIDALLYFLSSLGWFLASVLFFNILFKFNENLGSWSKNELFLLYGVHNLSFAFTVTFIWDSIHRNFAQAVRRGTIDLHLVKPLNFRFHTTTGVLDITGVLHLIPTSVLLYYSVRQLDPMFNWANILLFILMFMIGQFLTYNILCILYFLSFWTKSARSFGDIFWILQGKTKMPFNIIPFWLQFIFLFVLPISFFVFIPFKAALGLLEMKSLIIGIALCLVLWVVSQRMLKTGLKRYEGASI